MRNAMFFATAALLAVLGIAAFAPCRWAA